MLLRKVLQELPKVRPHPGGASQPGDVAPTHLNAQSLAAAEACREPFVIVLQTLPGEFFDQLCKLLWWYFCNHLQMLDSFFRIYVKNFI
jgi:hypothetical protein